MRPLFICHKNGNITTVKHRLHGENNTLTYIAPPLSPWHHCYHHGTTVIIMAPSLSSWHHRFHYDNTVITKKSLDQFLPKLAKYLFVVLFQKCVEQPQRLSKVVIVIKNSNHLLKISIKTTICI
jgi:hypothetical protein